MTKALAIIVVVLLAVVGVLALEASSAPPKAATLRVATVPVSSAQILNLYDEGVEVVPAPGVGKVTHIVAQFVQLTPGTTPYTGNTWMHLRYAGMGASYQTDISANVLTQTVPFVDGDTYGYLYNRRADVENKAVQLTVSTGNPTGGAGTLVATVYYVVVDLA